MDIIESEIEDLIQEYINTVDSNETDLPLYNCTVLRQVAITGYGRVDLLGIEYTPYRKTESEFKGVIDITPIEIKRGKISYNEVGQLARYIRGVKRVTNKIKLFKFNVRGLLIGKEIDENGDFVYLMNLVRNVDIYTFKLALKTGLSFDYQDFDGYYNSGENINKTISEYFNKKFYKEILKKQL